MHLPCSKLKGNMHLMYITIPTNLANICDCALTLQQANTEHRTLLILAILVFGLPPSNVWSIIADWIYSCITKTHAGQG